MHLHLEHPRSQESLKENTSSCQIDTNLLTIFGSAHRKTPLLVITEARRASGNLSVKKTEEKKYRVATTLPLLSTHPTNRH